MKPVEPVFGFGVEKLLQVPHALSTIGEKGHLLIERHALGLQQLEQAAFGFGVKRPNETKAFTGRKLLVFIAHERGTTSPSNDLEPSLFVRSAYIATINTHRKWAIGCRQSTPVLRAAIDKTAMLLAQSIFRALGHAQEVITQRDRIEFLIHWQCVFQQFCRDAIREQRGELRLQIE